MFLLGLLHLLIWSIGICQYNLSIFQYTRFQILAVHLNFGQVYVVFHSDLQDILKHGVYTIWSQISKK